MSHNPYSSGPPPVGPSPGSSASSGPGFGDVVMQMDQIVKAIKDVQWSLTQTKAALDDTKREIYDLNQKIDSEGTATRAHLRELSTSINYLRSGLCSSTAAQGGVKMTPR